jgi:hypothetical protein
MRYSLADPVHSDNTAKKHNKQKIWILQTRKAGINCYSGLENILSGEFT